MTTTQQMKVAFVNRWKAWVVAILSTGTLLTVGINWADERYDQSADIGEIRKNVEFLTREFIKDRITSLESRIQILGRISELSRDDRRTLNELRYERRQLQRRLDALDGSS